MCCLIAEPPSPRPWDPPGSMYHLLHHLSLFSFSFLLSPFITYLHICICLHVLARSRREYRPFLFQDCFESSHYTWNSIPMQSMPDPTSSVMLFSPFNFSSQLFNLNMGVCASFCSHVEVFQWFCSCLFVVSKCVLTTTRQGQHHCFLALKITKFSQNP